MKSEAAEQVAAPAELRNIQLALGTHQTRRECGWKGWRQTLGMQS